MIKFCITLTLLHFLLFILSVYLYVFPGRCDGHFLNGLRRYVEVDGAKDAAAAADESTDMKYLKQLMDEAARELDRLE